MTTPTFESILWGAIIFFLFSLSAVILIVSAEREKRRRG